MREANINNPPRIIINRRKFCFSAATLLASAHAKSLFVFTKNEAAPSITASDVASVDRDRVLHAANEFLKQAPLTITAYTAKRSSGGPNDYFSEGDYWWPDPKAPSGPYVRRDGFSNPENFNAHRDALIRMSLHVPALVAAWLITKDVRYSHHASAHIRAWFLNSETRMNPSLQYAQAIHGITTGRGTGIIDTVHLIEVVRAIQHLERTNALSSVEYANLRSWFADYLACMQNSPNGKEEEASTNNHGTCWIEQAAAFAVFTGKQNVVEYCRDCFRNKLLPTQMADNGSFPLELARSKPYSYSIFNLDVLSIFCQLVSEDKSTPDSLWQYKLPNGNTYQKAIEFMLPFLADKSKWPYPHDVEYFDDLPNRQPSLLFAGLAYRQRKYIALWSMLPPMPKSAEIIRNFPVRQPLLWLS